MSDIAIRADNLGKQYRLGPRQRYKTLRDALMTPFRRADSRPRETIWALKDVSFEIAQGEVVGVIGRNGAGKSTLLKILSRITEPSQGYVDVYGRIGSLLEVGTGFHPELTGRENIYLNGAILGMRRAEITKKFDEIVAFAETEKFLDTPVKHYSSGMRVRLAFAVAAHLEPEILLVDEVLAVGDAAFQKKCLGKMTEVARGGRTVLFVSHNMGTISSLTERCFFLKNGQIAQAGKTRDVVERYLTDALEFRQRAPESIELYRRDRHHDTPVRITRVWVNEPSETLPDLKIGEDFKICVELEAKTAIEGANFSLFLKDMQGHVVSLLYSMDADYPVYLRPGKTVLSVQVNGLPLAPGVYYADMGINQSERTVAYDAVMDFPLFNVSNSGQVVYWLERRWGALHWNRLQWSQSDKPA